MVKQKVIIRSHSPAQFLLLFIVLILLFGFTMYYIILGSTQQCMLCKPSETVFHITWLKIVVSLVIILGGMLALIISPLFGGLKERERTVLKWIYYKNEEKLIRYEIMKILRKNENEFRTIDTNQIYRMIERLEKFGYVEIDSKGRVSLTEWGMSFVNIF